VVFVDGAGVTRTLDVVAAPFGLEAAEVHATALPVEILDDGGVPSGIRFYVQGEHLLHQRLALLDRRHARLPHRRLFFVADRLLSQLADRRAIGQLAEVAPQMAPLNAAVVARTMVLNTLAGVVFGLLF